MPRKLYPFEVQYWHNDRAEAKQADIFGDKKTANNFFSTFMSQINQIK